MIFYVCVAVAHARPPKVDEYRKYAVEAEGPYDALLVAEQISACTSVMPVWAAVLGDEEHPPLELEYT